MSRLLRILWIIVTKQIHGLNHRPTGWGFPRVRHQKLVFKQGPHVIFPHTEVCASSIEGMHFREQWHSSLNETAFWNIPLFKKYTYMKVYFKEMQTPKLNWTSFSLVLKCSQFNHGLHPVYTQTLEGYMYSSVLGLLGFEINVVPVVWEEIFVQWNWHLWNQASDLWAPWYCVHLSGSWHNIS